MRVFEHQNFGEDPRWAVVAIDELTPQMRTMFSKLGQVTRLTDTSGDRSYCRVYLTFPNPPRDRPASKYEVRVNQGGGFEIPATETCGIQLELSIDRFPNTGETRVILTLFLGGWVSKNPQHSPVHLPDLEQAIREGIRVIGTYSWVRIP